MAKRRTKKHSNKAISALRHDAAKRSYLPTAEFQSLISEAEAEFKVVSYSRRNRDLDPQFVWRGKDDSHWSDLIVKAPPLFIQEKVNPKSLIDDLMLRTSAMPFGESGSASTFQPDLFADFDGIPESADRTAFYHHEANWSNRMILGDSLQVMASLAEREGLRGKVQCIYVDPPYGIRFNSNFQWSTTSRDVKDGRFDHITREPEQVKAYRDTWRDGIHSYLTYLRDRLTVARDLLAESGSLFVQIGDQNAHRVRGVLDEVFGDGNFVGNISFNKTWSFPGDRLPQVTDSILWYAKSQQAMKYRPLWRKKIPGGEGAKKYREIESISSLNSKSWSPKRLARLTDLTSQGASATNQAFEYRGKVYQPRPTSHWKTTVDGLHRLDKAGRIAPEGRTPAYVRFLDDFSAFPYTNIWMDIGGIQSRVDPKVYVVQTATEAVKRCVLMTTDPGDLVMDPTCGSGTTAYVAEQWGRRWITIDTSRVAMALARSRLMGARYPYYMLLDSDEGQAKEAEQTRTASFGSPTFGDIRQGFVYKRSPHVTLKGIASNAEIDVIWQSFEEKVVRIQDQINQALDQNWEEWEVPSKPLNRWPAEVRSLHKQFRELLATRQQEIDDSIAAHSDFEYLFDDPHIDPAKVRVAGPFTVESLSPHRMVVPEVSSELGPEDSSRSALGPNSHHDFAEVVLEHLSTSGVQQSNKADSIDFSSIAPWPGSLICAEGVFSESAVESVQRRAGIFVGPEFGTVSRPDLVEAAREAADAGFDILVSCAFNYEAHSTEFQSLGRIPVFKARMNADLHMAGELKNTGAGNLFVVFGEPDIKVIDDPDGRVKIKIVGVDVFHPSSGEIRSDNSDGIACWFIDTNYNEESFFVRHAYFLGANDPYKALKRSLKAEVNESAWSALHSDTSQPFEKPETGRIAVKVINHLGDEVMKVFRI